MTSRNLNIVLIIIILLMGGIIAFLTTKDPEKEIVKVPVEVIVEVPAKTGKSDTVKNPEPLGVPSFRPGPENPVNKVLLNKYIEIEASLSAAQDSVRKLNLYISAITERTYNQQFIDSTQKVNVYSKVRGSLLEQAIDYEIFPTTITARTEVDVEIPKRNSLYWLIEGGYPLLGPEGAKFAGKATFIFKNKKDALFSLSPDTNGNVWLGFGKQF